MTCHNFDLSSRSLLIPSIGIVQLLQQLYYPYGLKLTDEKSKLSADVRIIIVANVAVHHSVCKSATAQGRQRF